MRTLVVHTGAIGDFLLACPALVALSRETDLEVAGNPSRLALAVEAKIACAAHSLDAIGFHTAFDMPSLRLKKFLARFDRIVVFMRDDEGALRLGLDNIGVKRINIFPGLPDAAWDHHASDYYADRLGFENLSALRLEIAPAGPPLDVVIHPGSGSPTKNWPIENFKAVAAELTARGRQVTWCAGPAEFERGFSAPSSAVLSCDSLIDLARRLATAQCYVGNDSGITHLAAALGVDTIAIFGPTDPRVWAPRGENAQAIHGTPWPDISRVISATGSDQLDRSSSTSSSSS